MTTRADRAGLQIADVPASLAGEAHAPAQARRQDLSSAQAAPPAAPPDERGGPHLAFGPRGSMVSGVQR